MFFLTVSLIFPGRKKVTAVLKKGGRMRKYSKKRYFIWLVGVLLLFGHVQTAEAQVNNGAVYPVVTDEKADWPKGPDVYAETAVLMEPETGLILYDKGMNEKRYPASTTKVMTTLLALENCSLDEIVTFTEACKIDQIPGSGHIAMQVGEQLTMKQCLLAVMIKSANDVATEVGAYVAGSPGAFADMMNQRAKELGCKNTHFVNASGMPDPEHYTTAYDMALIFREALKNDDFREIIGTQSFTIEPTNKNPESRTYSTHHALTAQTAPEYYEGSLGGKTGMTNESRNTLVSGAERNGVTLIAVAFRASAGEVAQDHISLFNYGFEQFEKREVPGGTIIVPVSWSTDQLEVQEEVEGDKILRTYYAPDGTFLGNGQEEIQVCVPIEEETPEKTEEVKESQGDEKEGLNKNLLVLLVVLTVVFVGMIIATNIIKSRTKRKSREKNTR